MSQLSLMIDLERCFGCKSCEAACKQEHRLGPGEYRNKVVWLGSSNGEGLDFLTLTCQHCERLGRSIFGLRPGGASGAMGWPAGAGCRPRGVQ